MTINKAQTSDKSPVELFVISGLAGIATGLITNPADVLKTRLQLQGELSRPGSYCRLYRSTFHAAVLITQKEGLGALQSGLVPVLGLQLIINTIRLGSYNFAKRHGITLNDKGETDVLKTATLAGLAGSLAVIIGSPLYLAKVQLQTQSAGNIHGFNTWKIMKYLWKEGGFKSLYKGWNANVPRLFIGSSVQLTTFGLITDRLIHFETFNKRQMLVTLIASILSGTALVSLTHPLDVMATRLYNQGINTKNNKLYDGMLDAILKIIRTEGFLGLYKGYFPNWLRVAPLYIVSVHIFNDIIGLMYANLKNIKVHQDFIIFH